MDQVIGVYFNHALLVQTGMNPSAMYHEQGCRMTHVRTLHSVVHLPNPKYPKTKPKNIKVKEIGKPIKIANNITAIKIKPSVSGLINSAIMRQATFLF